MLNNTCCNKKSHNASLFMQFKIKVHSCTCLAVPNNEQISFVFMLFLSLKRNIANVKDKQNLFSSRFMCAAELNNNSPRFSGRPVARQGS